MSGLAMLLSDCSAQGVRLSVDSDGGLTVEAAGGVLTSKLVERLRASKKELVGCVQAATILWELRHAGLNVIPDDQRPGQVMLQGDWLTAPDELVDRCDRNWPAIKAVVLGEP